MDSVDSILDHLPPHTNQYQYHSFHRFVSNLSFEGARFRQKPDNLDVSQYILFTEISPQTYTRDFEQPVRDIISHNEDSYLPQHEALIIKMKGGPHETAHGEFNRQLIHKLTLMGSADDGLEPIGAKTINATYRSKEADLAYRPLNLPSGRSNMWPTLALESGYTDSQGTLHDNAQFWLSSSGGDVKIVITLDIDRRNKHFNVRLYNREPDGTINEQRVTVSQQFGAQNASVSHAPLIVSFQNLFLRDPTGNERDIEFGVDDMRRLARGIWNEQF